MKYQNSLKKGINRQISYTKLAMRNILDQQIKTLSHLLITSLCLVSLLIGLSYLNK